MSKTQVGLGISHQRNPTITGREAVEQALQSSAIEKPDCVFMFASVAYNQQTP